MSLVLPVIPSSLPQGFCPATYQEMLNAFDAQSTVTVPDGSLGGITVSASQPTDKTRPWLQLDVSGRPVRLYWFAQGAWLSQHPMVPGTTVWWFDTLPTFTTFDGGDTLTPNATALTGPMWQQAKLPDDTAIAAQFPIVAGTLASGTVLALGDVGGEELHSLTLPEIPTHSHTISARSGSDIDDGGRIIAGSGTEFPDSFASGTAGGDPVTPHNTMPPYAVGYLLQRTAKLFYSVF